MDVLISELSHSNMSFSYASTALHALNVSSNLSKGRQLYFPENGRLPLHWTFAVAIGLMTCFLPIIIVVGVVGNTASFFVFLSHDLRKLSSSIYVIAVLTSDTGILVGLMFVWLEVLGIRLNHMEGACQFLVFLAYACSFLSVWYTVCITVENYIAICHPTRVRTLCTRRRASVVVSVLAIATLPLYSLSAVATVVRREPITDKPHCELKQDEFVFAMHVMTLVDSVTTLLLPLVCVTTILVAIALSIIHTYRWRRSSPGSQKHRAELMRIPQVRVAKMLFALSISFVIMNSPSHIGRLYHVMASMGGGGLVPGRDVGGKSLGDDEELLQLRNNLVVEEELIRDSPVAESQDSMVSSEDLLVHWVLLYISYCNYAVKFVLFLCFSKNFRRCIKEFCSEGFGMICTRRSSAPVAV